MSSIQSKSIVTGTVLTAGTAVGAGMFSLPVAASGMWLSLSLFFLFVVWYLSCLSALYLLEANVKFEPGASFNTIVKSILGNTWNILAGASIAFLLYILLYAYFSAFGSILSKTIPMEGLTNSRWSQGLLSVLFGGILAAAVWWSTKVVGRISTLLVTGMVITFVVSMSGLALQMELVNLLDGQSQDSQYAPYIWAALPYFITSFGFSSIVPSLYKYYGKDPQSIRKSIIYGSFIAFIIYCLFLVIIFGNISREAFVEINKVGGNIGTLVGAITQSEGNTTINLVLTIFSNFAIITSFLGAGLGLFDYIADLFKFSDTAKDRFYIACLTFLPSGILSFFFPNGFIAAIGFAGLVLIFGLFLIPFLMIRKLRKQGNTSNFTVKGGKPLLYFFIISSLGIATCYVLSMLDFLPKW